jgi:hypothetical protein
MANAFGVSMEEMRGKHCYEIMQGSPAPCRGRTAVKAFSTGEFREGEIITPDGRTWMSAET